MKLTLLHPEAGGLGKFSGKGGVAGNLWVLGVLGQWELASKQDLFRSDHSTWAGFENALQTTTTCLNTVLVK